MILQTGMWTDAADVLKFHHTGHDAGSGSALFFQRIPLYFIKGDSSDGIHRYGNSFTDLF